MKKHRNNFLISLLVVLLLVACERDEVGSFEAGPAVNFVSANSSYTFMTNPEAEYTTEIPVEIIGDSTVSERRFAVEVIADSLTTASADMYSIEYGIVEAGNFQGALYLKVYNTEALDSTEVSLHLRITDSPDFIKGNIETIDHTFTWTNKILVPAWNYFRYFFCPSPSTAAYKAFIASTGRTDFTNADYRALGADGAEALGRKFGDYIKQYNLEHPGAPMFHDDGPEAGQPIAPIYYTHSIYD